MAKALTKMAKIAIFTKFEDFAYDKEPMAEKYAKNIPYVTNMRNQKYSCQPPPKNAKFQKFGTKLC